MDRCIISIIEVETFYQCYRPFFIFFIEKKGRKIGKITSFTVKVGVVLPTNFSQVYFFCFAAVHINKSKNSGLCRIKMMLIIINFKPFVASGLRS